jgi:hypothetical protein
MNKMKIMLAALLCSTAVLADEPKGLDKILPAVSDYSGDTDAAFLEAHQPLLKAPEEGAEKDVKYWAEAVGSRLKVTGYAQAGYSANFYEGNKSANVVERHSKRVKFLRFIVLVIICYYYFLSGQNTFSGYYCLCFF